MKMIQKEKLNYEKNLPKWKNEHQNLIVKDRRTYLSWRKYIEREGKRTELIKKNEVKENEKKKKRQGV
jgi:hypothetical protein